MSLIIPTQTCYGGKNQTSDDVPGIAPGAWEAVHCYKNLALVITITQYWLHSQYFWNVIRCLVAWLSSGLSSSEIPTSSSPLLPAVWAASHTEATRKGNSKALSTYCGPVATLGVFLFLLRKARHSVSLLLVPQCFRKGSSFEAGSAFPVLLSFPGLEPGASMACLTPNPCSPRRTAGPILWRCRGEGVCWSLTSRKI